MASVLIAAPKKAAIRIGNPLKEQIELEGLPKPGEPLRPDVHPVNIALLKETIEERQRRLNAKLSWWQLRRLRRRYRALWARLNKAHYNVLVKERHDLFERYQLLKQQYADARAAKQPRRAISARARAVAAHGKALDECIARLQPLADEFELVAGRLRAHDETLRWEREDRENVKAFRREAYVWQAQLIAAFKQSPRLHYKGIDSNGNVFVKIPTIDRIVMKDDRVLYHVRTSAQNAIERAIGRWHSALPYGVDIAGLTCPETLENLSSACNRVVTVERSRRGTNIFYAINRLDSPDGIPLKVLFSKVLQWYPTDRHAEAPWAAGVTSDRKIEWFSFEQQPHVLIAGSTQSGKSNHVNSMIATLVSMQSPDEVRLLLIDMKGGIEFSHWAGIGHELKPMIKSAEQVLPALEYLRVIMNERLEIFEKARAKNLSSYNRRHPAAAVPRIIVFIDEMATLIGLGELSTAIHNELRVLTSQGRAVGIHLVICTQHSSVDVLPGWIKTNMVLRASGKMPSHQASMVILDSINAALLPPIAGRMIFSIGRSEIIAQSPYISDEAIARAVKISQEFAPSVQTIAVDAPVAITVTPRFTVTDYLDLAMQLGGNLSPARIHENCGNEVATLRTLRKMLAEIVESHNAEIEHRGIVYAIKKFGSGYKLVERLVEQPVEQLSALVEHENEALSVQPA
jgi:hypothetical protein